MDMNFEKLGAYIARIRKEKGLSRYELASRMGYTNLSKGVNRVKDLEMGVKRRIYLTIPACKALELNVAEMHQALADDVIAMRKAELQSWLESRTSITRILKSSICHNCPFLCGSFCHHPLLDDGPRKLKVARYAGLFRPDWCPLGFIQG